MGLTAMTVTALVEDALPSPARAQADRKKKLPRVKPEIAGIAPESVLAFLEAVDAKVGGLHSFMLLRHGKVAAEGWWTPYAPQLPHMLYSLSKSFTSTAVGLAAADGLLTVDDPVISFFSDRVPTNVPPNLATMRVRHLLSMSTGHDKDATGPTTAAKDGDWVKAFLELPVEHAPGSKFVYNSAATYMCSAIVQKKTGKTVLEYLTPRLFEPLGIQNPTWESCPKGINTGGWGLSVKTEDIARFGQLYLQKGQWNGKQIVPAAWVEEATSKQIANGTGDTSDWSQGYGYQFWRCRHGAYRGDGAFGQYCVIFPEQEAVLAITSGVRDMQAVLNAVWEHLLPGMRPTEAPSDKSDALRQKVSKLAVPLPEGKSDSPNAKRVNNKTYRLETNPEKWESAHFAFSSNRATITLRGEGSERKIASDSGKWQESAVPAPSDTPRLGAPPAGKTAARGAWTADDTFTIKVCYIETPYIETITCKFSGEDVTIGRNMNVGFGPTERPLLTGRAGG